MFTKNANGEWWCSTCEKPVIRHTQEELRQCSTEIVKDDDGRVIGLSALDATVAYNPKSGKLP
jgi:hypothetical protein